MKVFRTILAAVAVAALTILVQTVLTTGATSAETVPQPAAPANIGIIDSSAFGHPKEGIARVMNAMSGLEAKFQPIRAELRGMRDRLTTLRADIQKKRTIQDAATTARQVEEANNLELQIKRKSEDAAESYKKESDAITDPLQRDILTALNAYAQAKGITLVLDARQIPIIYVASSLDITRDFINDYNRTHPAGAAPAPARPTPATARPTPATTRPSRP